MKVGIGPVFTEIVGLPIHIMAIKKYSIFDVQDIPSARTRKLLARSVKRERLFRELMNYSHILGLYDIVHSHDDAWFTELSMKAHKAGSKWLHTYHTMYFEEDYPNGFQEWQKKLNRSQLEVAPGADVRICISNWFHDMLLNDHSIETTVIPNGYDSRKCEDAKPNRFLEKHNLQDFILFVGRNNPVKKPELFIDLANQIPEQQFAMIGPGFDEEHVNKWLNRKNPKNLYLLGEMNHEAVMDAMAAAKVYVMTSRREGIPTVLLEAMGLGKPCVVPNHSGCIEVLHSEEFGFLYDMESLDELVEKTHAALESKNVGARARHRAKTTYSWGVIVKQVDEVYKSLAD